MLDPTTAPGPGPDPRPGGETEGAAGARRALTVAVAVLTALSLLAPLTHLFVQPGVDFMQFWILGRAMPFEDYDRFDGDEVYQRRAKRVLRHQKGDPVVAQALGSRRDLQVTATPLFYALFALTETGDYPFDLRLFQIASFALFFVGSAYLLRIAGASWQVVGLLLSMLSMFYLPLRSDLNVTNTAQLSIGLVALHAWLLRRRRLVLRTAGAQSLIGFLTLVKPVLVFALPVLVVLRLATRRWKHVGLELCGGLAGAGAGLLVPLAMGAPFGLWRDFAALHVRYIERGTYEMSHLGELSAVETLIEALGLGYAHLAVLVAAGFLAAAVALAARAKPRPGNPTEETLHAAFAIGIGLALFLVVTPLAWLHYYVLSLPLVFLLLRAPEAWGRWERARAGLACLALGLLAAHPITQLAGLFGLVEEASRDSLMTLQVAGGNGLALVVGVADLVRGMRRKPVS